MPIQKQEAALEHAGFCMECRFFFRSSAENVGPGMISHGLCDVCAEKDEPTARVWGQHQTHDRRAVAQSSVGSAARIA